MKLHEIISLLVEELNNAEREHPDFYSDIIHTVSIMNEEAGEAIKAALDFTYSDGTLEDIIKEVIQTGATAIRILKNIDYITKKESFI